MSSILIKDIEMPKERESFTVTIKYNGLVFDTETGIQVAEAQEIPPHGRLADMNELGKKYDEIVRDFCHGNFRSGWDCLCEVREILDNAPAIIPAEENMKTTNAIEKVAIERKRQIELWGNETHDPFEWVAILGEEYGELCQAINETYLLGQRYPERGGVGNIIKEATHVAAVALAIIEAFGKEGE